MKYTRYAVSSAEADIASGRADQDILIWEKSTNPNPAGNCVSSRAEDNVLFHQNSAQRAEFW
jgi:hypothetical protein